MRVYVNNIKRFKKAKLPALSVGKAVAGVLKDVLQNVPQGGKNVPQNVLQGDKNVPQKCPSRH